MTRSITITDASTPGAGETITGRSYRLLAADGTTVLSTANPPYIGVSDGLLYVEQTVTQSDAQTDVQTLAIPGRVTDLAATNAAAPVLTWTDVGGETSYEIHRGAAGFTPDVAGHTTRVKTAASGAETLTDNTVSGDGSTEYAYRVVALAAGGYTIGNEATCTPAGAFAGQFQEDWSSNSIRSTLWDAVTNKSGTGDASAATGSLVLTTTSASPSVINVINPGSNGNRYDLTTAGAQADGFVVDVQALAVPANAYIAIEDATGLGFAFYISAGTSFEFGRLSAGAGAIGSRFSSSSSGTYVPGTDRYFRFRYDGAGNVELATSPDNTAGSWIVKQTFANSAGVTLTAVGFGFGVNSGSSDNSLTIGTVTAN